MAEENEQPKGEPAERVTREVTHVAVAKGHSKQARQPARLQGATGRSHAQPRKRKRPLSSLGACRGFGRPPPVAPEMSSLPRPLTRRRATTFCRSGAVRRSRCSRPRTPGAWRSCAATSSTSLRATRAAASTSSSTATRWVAIPAHAPNPRLRPIPSPSPLSPSPTRRLDVPGVPFFLRWTQRGSPPAVAWTVATRRTRLPRASPPKRSDIWRKRRRSEKASG